MNKENGLLRQLVFLFGLVVGCAFIAYESRYHFDRSLVDAKKQVHSAQRNWSAFYGQSNVYLSGGLRHNEDFSKLSIMLEPDSAVITDLATSYYMAAMLPIYVKHVHPHHGLYRLSKWGQVISSQLTCYIEVPENLDKFKAVFKASQQTKAGITPVRYIAVNKTQNNANFKRGCMSQRRSALMSVINQLGVPFYEGESIVVYRLSTTASQSH